MIRSREAFSNPSQIFPREQWLISCIRIVAEVPSLSLKPHCSSWEKNVPWDFLHGQTLWENEGLCWDRWVLEKEHPTSPGVGACTVIIGRDPRQRHGVEARLCFHITCVGVWDYPLRISYDGVVINKTDLNTFIKANVCYFVVFFSLLILILHFNNH